MLIVQGLANSVAAAIAGFFAGWLDTRIGSKGATIFFVVGCLVANLVLCSVTTEMVFFVPIDVAATSTGGLYPTLPDKIFLVTQCCHRVRRDGRPGDRAVADGENFATLDAQRVLQAVRHVRARRPRSSGRPPSGS